MQESFNVRLLERKPGVGAAILLLDLTEEEVNDVPDVLWVKGRQMFIDYGLEMLERNSV